AAALALAAVPRAHAQGTVRSEVDSRRIGVQDAVQLTITVEGGALPDQIPMPALTNLRVVGGPSVSTEMSFVNGRSSQSRSWTWALQAEKVGHAEVDAVSVGGASAPAIPTEEVAGRPAPPTRPPRTTAPVDMTPFRGPMERHAP